MAALSVQVEMQTAPMTISHEESKMHEEGTDCCPIRIKFFVICPHFFTLLYEVLRTLESNQSRVIRTVAQSNMGSQTVE